MLGISVDANVKCVNYISDQFWFVSTMVSPAMNGNFEFGKFSNYNTDRSLPTKYEKSPNGDVDYVCSIDIDGFAPSDIKIQQSGTMLIVEAQKSKCGSKQGVHGSSEESEYKEFKKEISLPNNIDINRKLKSVYNDNGILEIRIPTVPQSYSTLYPPSRIPISYYRNLTPHVSFNISTPQLSTPVFSSSFNTNCIGSRPLSGNFNSFNGSLSNLRRSMRSFMNLSEQPKWYSEEIIIDPIYKPEELIVRTKGNRVIINAKHEEVGSSGYNNVKEFSNEHDLPSNVDLDQLKATLLGTGILLIEAPYKHMSYTKAPIAIQRD